MLLAPALVHSGDRRLADAPSLSADAYDGMVPPGMFVVLGDNAAWSHDSRVIGCVPAERLLGVMIRPLTVGQPGLTAPPR
jgi:type IV secretory pathway protease TraF